MRHFRSLFDVSIEEHNRLLADALRLKREHAAGADQRVFPGKVLALLFEKPSMRTRVSFESAMAHLGGSSIFLSGAEVGLGVRETVADVARVISTYVDVLAVRTFSHNLVVELAAHASCPVINALSDWAHPCQALGDLCTLLEAFGELDGLRMTFVGDGNNVARALATASVYSGIDFVLCAPPGYDFSPDFLAELKKPGYRGTARSEPDLAAAVVGADVVYTDVWASMGQEAEQAERRKIFAPYQVNAALLARAKPTAKLLHCLPAHRGEEVTADVIDGPQSVVVEQAANRLHAQKALMLWLLTEAKKG